MVDSGWRVVDGGEFVDGVIVRKAEMHIKYK
jgi:hypothetical protein